MTRSNVYSHCPDCCGVVTPVVAWINTGANAEVYPLYDEILRLQKQLEDGLQFCLSDLRSAHIFLMRLDLLGGRKGHYNHPGLRYKEVCTPVLLAE